MDTINFACRDVPIEQVIRCGLGLSKSEYEVLIFFLKNNKEFSIDEVSSLTKKDRTTVQKQIKSLIDSNILFRRQENLDNGGYKFYYKIKDKEKLKSIILDNFKNYQNRVINVIEKI